MKLVKKKIVAISIIIAILATFIPIVEVQADTTPIVTLNSSTPAVRAGEQFILSIDFANGLSGQKALSFTVNYDSTKLTVQSDYETEDGGIIYQMLGDDDGQALNHTMGNRLSYGRIDGNTIKIAFAHYTAMPTSGTLANIKFTAKAGFDAATDITIGNIKCSTSSDDTDYPQTASVTINPIIDLTGITVSPTTLNLNRGQNSTLTAAKVPSNTTDTATISWASNNAAVATVDGSGNVSAVGKGTARITATCGSFSGYCDVTVTVALEGLNISTTTFNLTKGQTTTAITASKTPGDTDDTTPITWTSNNTGVVTISNATGTTPTIHAVGAGTATITATCGSFSKTCDVTVSVPLENIKLEYEGTTTEVTDKIVVEKGHTVTITATKLPTDTTETSAISWSIDDTSKATVSNGTITGVNNGNTTLTVSCAGHVYRTVPVEVINPITAIAINEGNFELQKNQIKNLTINYTPSDTTSPTAVGWTSSNTAVATVDGTGKVTAVAPGTSVITATLVSNSSITSSITVTVPVVSATSLNINKTSTSIEKGGNETLTAYILPENTTDELTISWASNNTSVATVDSTGKVVAVAPGTAVITATAGSLTPATCTVTVTRKLDSLSFNITSMTLNRGDTSSEALVVSYKPFASIPAVVWRSPS